MPITQPNNHSTISNPVGRFMVAAGAVIELAGTDQILIVRRAPELDWRPNEWEITYGRIDQGESVEQGLRREVKEELGITELTVVCPLTCWHIYRGPELPENELIGITYYATTTTNNVTVSSEHTEYRWVTPAEALDIQLVEGIQRDIKKYLEVKPTIK